MQRAQCLAALAAALCLAATPVLAEFMSVTSEKVNIRDAPGSGSEVVTDAWKLTPFRVLDRKGNWVHVEGWDRERGWVHKSVLASAPAVIVRSKQANLRSEPGSGPVAWRVEQGYPLAVVAKKGNWIQVRDEEETLGWIHKSLVWGEGTAGEKARKGKARGKAAKPPPAEEEPVPVEEEAAAEQEPAEEGAEAAPAEEGAGTEAAEEQAPAPAKTDRPKLKKRK